MNPLRLLLLAASRRHNRDKLIAALRATRSALKASEAAREIGNETAAGLHTDIYRLQRDAKAELDELRDRLREANDVIEAVEARLKTADETIATLSLNLANLADALPARPPVDRAAAAEHARDKRHMDGAGEE